MKNEKGYGGWEIRFGLGEAMGHETYIHTQFGK